MSVGLGVMISTFAGCGRDINDFIGKKITNAEFTTRNSFEDTLRLSFDDGTGLDIFDGGQSCCENRYMHSEDDPIDLVGGTLVGINEKDVIYSPNEEESHEVMFVEIASTAGSIILETHNEHNGYYGGFYLQIEEIPVDISND